MKSLKYLSVLFVLILAGCASEPKVDTEPPRITANPPAKQVKATPKPTLDSLPKPDVAPAVSSPAENPVLPPIPPEAKTPEKDPLPPPKAEVKATEKEPLPPPKAKIPEKEVEPPSLPQGESSVPPPLPRLTFRCAYWERPVEPVALYLNVDGTFQQLPLYELAFGKVYSLPQGKITLYTKQADTYKPYFSIDPCGLSDCAAIIFPETNAGKRKTTPYSQVHLCDFSEKSAPYGSLVVYNWSGFETPVRCVVAFRDGKTEEFSLKNGEYCATSEISAARLPCEFKIFGIDSKGQEKELASSSLVLRKDTCFYLYLTPPKDGTPESPIGRKSFKRYKVTN